MGYCGRHTPAMLFFHSIPDTIVKANGQFLRMLLWSQYYSVKKNRKNIYRSDIQVTFELYGNFRCLHVLIPNKQYLLSTVLLSRFQSSRGALKSTELMQFMYLPVVNFTGLAGIVNTTVYMTEPIFTGLGMTNCPNFNTVIVLLTKMIWHDCSSPLGLPAFIALYLWQYRNWPLDVLLVAVFGGCTHPNMNTLEWHGTSLMHSCYDVCHHQPQ